MQCCYYHSSIKPSVQCRSSNSKPSVVRPRASKQFRRIRNKSIEHSGDFSLTRALRAQVDSGNIKDALEVFDKMTDRSNAYIWNLVIRGFANDGFFSEAVDFYCKMVNEGVRADKFTYPIVFKACGALSLSFEGQTIHAKVLKVGLEYDVCVGNSLCSMYAKLGRIESAIKVFDEMPVRDVVSWNSLITGHVAVGDGRASLMCLSLMWALGLKPDRFTLVGAISACSIERLGQTGREVHCQVIKLGFDFDLNSDVAVRTSLLDMYNKCGRIDYGERLFLRVYPKNVVVWNAMIGGYVRNFRPIKAFECLRNMQGRNGNFIPDAVTILNFLPACRQIGSFSHGKSIHGFTIRSGFLPHVVLETALMEFYGQFGKPTLAERIFAQMTEKSLITWNSMISVYVENGLNLKAIGLFRELLNEPLKPDSVTFSSIVPAFSETASLYEGKQIHGFVSKSAHNSNTFVLNSILYMYSKCGDIKTARKIFDRIVSNDVSSWNSMIMGYALHGFGREAIELYNKMRDHNIIPNHSTFVSLLTSCSVSGLVEEGLEFYHSMRRDHGIEPSIEHHGCVLDLIGRSGKIREAESFIKQTILPVGPTGRIWGSFLTAAKNHRDLGAAEFAARRIFELDSDNDNTGCYVLLSNMYCEAEMWDEFERLRSIMRSRGIERAVGFSFVESGIGKAHRFISGDRSHFRTNLIYEVLDILMKKIGRERSFSGVTKRLISSGNHSVRLAICFGLVTTRIGDPIVVRKSKRVCRDCHTFVKKVSLVTKREIIVGDSKIFHNFRGGICSCGDYW